MTLHIENVAPAIMRRLKAAAKRNDMTLKDYVLHTLQAAMDDAEMLARSSVPKISTSKDRRRR